MLFRWLFKKFSKNGDAPVWLFYLPVCMSMFFCYYTLSEHRNGNIYINIVTSCLTSAIVLFAIATNLRRFVEILQKPYKKTNLHIALSSVFATVILFAAVYCILYLYLPNAFYGMSGNTPLDECVNAVYFSATVFTTVGFGDIYPVAPLAKIFVTVEMMSFFVFFVVMIGNHAAFIKTKTKKEESGDNENKESAVYKPPTH